MWNGNNKLHQIDEEKKKSIDDERIKKGLKPLWSKIYD